MNSHRKEGVFQRGRNGKMPQVNDVMVVPINSNSENPKDDISKKNDHVDQIYNKIYGTGLFYWLVALSVGFGYASEISYLLPYMLKFPQLVCTGNNPNDGEYLYSCTAKEICSMEEKPYYMLDTTSDFTFNNLINKLGLLCISDFELGLFGSLYIAGFVFGSFSLLRLGDIFGRKRVLLCFSILNISLFISLYFVQNIKMTYAIIFACGAIRICVSQLSYILMVELIPFKMKGMFSSFVMAFEAVIGFATIGIIYILRDTFASLLGLIIFASIQVISVAYSPESPKFLESINKRDEMNDSLKTIARVNGCNISNNEFDLNYSQDSIKKNGSISLAQSLMDTTYRTNIMILCYLYCVSYTGYYVISYYIGKFPGNLFVNAFAIILADIVANFLMSVLAHYFGIKRSYTLIYAMILSATICFYFYSSIPEISYACVFIMRFGVSVSCTLSIYSCSSLFETSILSRSAALCNFVGRSFSILSPMVVTMTSNPLSLVGILGAGAIAACQFLIVTKK